MNTQEALLTLAEATAAAMPWKGACFVPVP